MCAASEEDLERFLQRGKRSAPGPDGLSYDAWRSQLAPAAPLGSPSSQKAALPMTPLMTVCVGADLSISRMSTSRLSPGSLPMG